MIYLDNAATSFPRPETVLDEMDRVNRTLSVNTGRGGYKAAREASEIIQETKNRVETLFNCHGAADVIFTPSVTHAFNQILNGLTFTENSVIYVSVYEHNAVARTVNRIQEETGCCIEFLPVDPGTLKIDLEKTKYLFSVKKPDYVIMSVVSNVTGYRLPAESVFGLAKEYGAVTIADAAQAAGLVEIDYNTFNADIIGFAGHKTMCGPFGVGGFVLRKGLVLKPSFTGGTGSNSLNLNMPEDGSSRYEAGSPNVVAVSGLNAALKWLDREDHEERIRQLTKRLILGLSEIDSVTVLGASDPDMCLGIVSFVVEGYDSNDIGSILDEEFDIAVRTGYHCAPFVHKYLEDQEYNGTIRAGIGPFNTEEDIDSLLSALKTL